MDNVSNISLVIPCLNEEKRLPATLTRIEEFNKQHLLINELILVIEPSYDNTLKIAQNYAMNKDNVVVVENRKRLGKGGSVREGMLHASNPYVAFTDADGSIDFSFLVQGSKTLKNGRDIAIASRYLDTSRALNRQPLTRNLLSKAFSYVVRKNFHMDIKDTQCGFKLFKKDVVNPLFSSLEEQGFLFDLEILLKAVSLGYTIEETGCTWEDKPGSTVKPFRDSLSMIHSMYKLHKKYMGKQVKECLE